MRALGSKLTYANVVATLALFLALGGVGYAAVVVTGKNVKDGSLTGKDVRDGSLRTADLAKGDVAKLRGTGAAGLAGPRGEKGDPGVKGEPGLKGDAGPVGTALAYAYVQDFGNPQQIVDPDRSSGITSAMVTRASAGVYCFELSSLGGARSVVATAEPSFGNAAENDKYVMAQALPNTDFGLGCPATSDAVAVVRDQSDAAPVDWFLNVWFE